MKVIKTVSIKGTDLGKIEQVAKGAPKKEEIDNKDFSLRNVSVTFDNLDWETTTHEEIDQICDELKDEYGVGCHIEGSEFMEIWWGEKF